MPFEYIEWNKQMLDDYLKDKFKRRGVASVEYEFLTKHIREIKPEVIVDIGCFFGDSTYILGTSSPNLKSLYAIENIESENFCPYHIDGIEVPKEDYGKFHQPGVVFKKNGYENDLLPILKEHPGAFVFLDAVKLTERVLHELTICHEGNAEYVALHDTSKFYKNPRRAMKRAIQLGWFELIDETNVDSPTKVKVKGVSLLRKI